jgi:hypothetical protein
MPVVVDLGNIVQGSVGVVVGVMIAARGGIAHYDDDGADAAVKVEVEGEAEVDD